jgi:hypothetical protein
MGLKAPGLKKRPRKGGGTAYYWVPSAVSKHAAGYPTRSVRLVGDPQEIAHQCRVLTEELKEWLSGKSKRKQFNGSMKSLIDQYQIVPESSYHELRSNSRESYNETLKLLTKTVGDRQLKKLTGVDFKRWYAKYKEPVAPGEPERMRRAYKAMQLVRILMKFGVMMNFTECIRLNTVLGAMEFSVPKPRTVAIEFHHVQAICQLAIAKGRPSIALAQALQFELTLRQIDVIGRWERTDEIDNGGIVYKGKRWRDGLLWSHLSPDGVLSKMTSKTEQMAEHDTRAYPFLRSIIDAVPAAKRFGPMIVDEETGRPYRYKVFAREWRAIADEVGVPKGIWNRDSRAGGVTEGSDAGADIEHLRHHANHSNIATTTRYNRRTLEKTRQVADLRVHHRATKNASETGK